VNTSTAVSMPRSTWYSPNATIYLSQGIELLSPNPELEASVSRWFYAVDIVPELKQIQCPTANCTWGPFETLAICSACTDKASRLLTFGCFDEPGDWLPSPMSLNSTSQGTSSENTTSCGYFLNATSDSRVLMTSYAIERITMKPKEALATRIFPLIDTNTRQRYYSGSLEFQDFTKPIVDVLIVGNSDVASIYKNSTPVAHECSLTWCVKTVTAESFFGSLTENEIRSWQNETYGIDPWRFSTSASGIEMYEYIGNVTLNPPIVERQPQQAEPTTFGLTNNTMLSTIFLTDYFAPSYFTANNATSPLTCRYRTMSGNETFTVDYNPWAANTTEQISKIAEVMSITIRNTPSSEGNRVETIGGIAWELRPHVKIRWLWITLPAIILVLSGLFVVSTVVKTSKEVEY
jgi:hypothetical protein